jgi:hypothetical protein
MTLHLCYLFLTCRFSAAGCSYFEGSVYAGLDACSLKPTLLNDFGQTLYLTGYNLTLLGFYEYYPQLVYRMTLRTSIFVRLIILIRIIF